LQIKKDADKPGLSASFCWYGWVDQESLGQQESDLDSAFAAASTGQASLAVMGSPVRGQTSAGHSSVMGQSALGAVDE
jgi:hypothetical protein